MIKLNQFHSSFFGFNENIKDWSQSSEKRQKKVLPPIISDVQNEIIKEVR